MATVKSLVKFEVLVPDWTPVQDLIFVSIEGIYFGGNGGVPMVRREHRLWTAEYLAEADQLLEYKYNRNDFGFSTDEQFLPDSDETRRAIEVGTESMSVRDEITGWRWLSKEVPQAQNVYLLAGPARRRGGADRRGGVPARLLQRDVR